MPLRQAPVTPRSRRPRLTIRLRLTILYGALFLASGVGLLAITYALVQRQVTATTVVSGQFGGNSSTGSGVVGGPGVFTSQQRQFVESSRLSWSASMLNQLLVQSGVALAVMALISIGLGWLVAGRVLTRVQTITRAARAISATNLDERLALDGPDDELKDLAVTFNGLLSRLEGSFSAQRQFVANASHELRTPLTLERAILEVALADPDADVDSLRSTCERVLAAGEQQERLIEALLTLARSELGLDRPEPFDLAVVTAEVLATRGPQFASRWLRLDNDLAPAPTSGDTRLAERLVANLVDNAVRYNVDRGLIRVVTHTRAGRAVLSVSNSGPVVPAAEVQRLFRPFQRGGADRTSSGDGLGLGLSIVHAVAVAHGASLTAHARPEGGLDIELSFRAEGGPVR